MNDIWKLLNDKDYTVARIKFFIEKLERERNPQEIYRSFSIVQELAQDALVEFGKYNENNKKLEIA